MLVNLGVCMTEILDLVEIRIKSIIFTLAGYPTYAFVDVVSRAALVNINYAKDHLDTLQIRKV